MYIGGLDLGLTGSFTIVFGVTVLQIECEGLKTKPHTPTLSHTEYLAVFSQMIAFHEPALFNHLDSTAFNPEVGLTA